MAWQVAVESFVYGRTEQLHLCLSGCERLLRTPSPPGYVATLRTALGAFLGVLPFVLLELGWGMVPVVLATAVILLGTEDLAVQLEVTGVEGAPGAFGSPDALVDDD